MPTYQVTDPSSGKSLSLTGDSPPTEAELSAIFAHPAVATPSPLIDAVRSLPGGLAQGVAGMMGLPGDVESLANSAGNWLRNKVTGGNEAPVPEIGALPTSSDLNALFSKPTGGYYQPKTTLGRYAETAASFAPAAIGGEATIPARILGRVLAPAVASRAVGDAVPDSSDPLQHWLHVGAQTAGAVAGSAGFAGAVTGVKRALTPALPETVANNYIASLLDKQGITPAELTANAIGRGQTAAEAIGPAGVSALQTLGRRSPAVGESLAAGLTDRASSAPDRMLADYASSSGIDPNAAMGDMQNIIASGRQAANPLYKAALEAAPNTSDYLARLAQEPIIQQGMVQGIKEQRLRALAKNEPFDPKAYAVTDFNEAGDPVIGCVPTWHTWDAAKVGLDQMLENNRNPVTGKLALNGMGGAIDQVRRSMLNELDSLNPDYKAARSSASDYLSANDAFQRGQKTILNPNVTVANVNDMLGKMSDGDKEAFKGGVANKLFNMQQNGSLKPRFVLAPAVQGKLSSILGPSNAASFVKNILSEKSLAETGNRMMPRTNSPTFELLNESRNQDMLGHAAAGLKGAKAVGHLAVGNIGSAVSHGAGAAWHFLPDRIKTGGMSPEAMNSAGTLLMMDPNDLAAQLRGYKPPPRLSLPMQSAKYLGLFGGNYAPAQ